MTTKVPTYDEWFCLSIFHTTCTVENKKCHLIGDGGSYGNVVNKSTVDKVKLSYEKLKL